MKTETRNLVKKFGDKVALNNLDLTIGSNKIIGLLGRNGSGKTTLLQLLAGHTKPSSGEVLINGERPFNQGNILKNICLISEANNFKRKLKIKEILKIVGRFYPNWSQQTAERLLKEFNLTPSLNAKGLSKGMESSLSIIIGLSSHSNITVFDEPYIGMDASARYRFYDILLEEYETHPRTFIISTHLIDEVSNLFEEVILIQNGSMLLHESTEEMKNKSLKVTGSKDKIDVFSEGKNVIHTSQIMGQKTE
jgi:ABC-2 type transport system ATP-binding protein